LVSTFVEKYVLQRSPILRRTGCSGSAVGWRSSFSGVKVPELESGVGNIGLSGILGCSDFSGVNVPELESGVGDSGLSGFLES
jgi:hypothetical protein